MPITHKFVTAVPDGGNPGDVKSSNWNDVHNWGLASTAYSANANVPNTIEVIEGTGGAGGITLSLPSAAANANKVFYAKKVDSGAGAVTINDVAAALIDGDSSYVLLNQWQYVVLQSNGTRWNVIGGN